jgi:hypothetical protein
MIFTDMKKFNMIDFKHLFYLIREEPYVFIKHEEIESFKPAGSVGVFCFNMNNLASRIINYGRIYLIENFEINIKSYGQVKTELHFRINNDVVFSFILFQSTPQFDNVFIEPSYIYSIIENAQAIHYEYDGNKFPVFIPSKVDTLVWKYIEYLDKYEYMPNSYEHYSSIINKLSSQRISFFDKIDIYVKRKPEDYDSVSTNLVFKKRLTVTQIKRLIKKMPSPFAEVLLFVANKTYKLYHGRN